MKIAITGHRPDKLGGYAAQEQHRAIRQHMKTVLTKFQEDFQDIVLISGCALGIDQWWISVGHLLQIPVIAAIPFEGFDSRWPFESKKNLQDLLAKCHEVKYISEPGYAAYKLQKRNEWMVDHCDLLVAYWNGTSGGTKNCVEYALKKKKDLIRFDPHEIMAKI